MIHYILVGSDGRVFQRGRCADESEIPAVPGMSAEVVQEDDPRTPQSPAPPGYAEHRAMDYPPFGDQLDALWRVVHALDMAGVDPVAQEVLEAVRAVKARYPKDQA